MARYSRSCFGCGVVIVAAVEQSTPFMVLPLDMPPPPLFQDEGLVPQVPLFGLFNKYDGSTEKVSNRHCQAPRPSIRQPDADCRPLCFVRE